MSSLNDATRRGYPLGALFVLVAASAVLIAGVTPVIRQGIAGLVPFGMLLAGFGAGAGVGLFLGILVGLHHYRRASGILIGATVGSTIGAVGGLMAMTPIQQLPAAAVAIVAGSALVVGVALIMRRAGES
jgi:hypothetical protein